MFGETQRNKKNLATYDMDIVIIFQKSNFNDRLNKTMYKKKGARHLFYFRTLLEEPK